MKKLTLKQQLALLKKSAKKRGLTIRSTPKLRNIVVSKNSKIPYNKFRAMNPMAAKEAKIEWDKNTIGYYKWSKYTPKNHVMDIRHELIEYDAMKKRGWKYPTAHKLANRKQLNINAIK